MSTVDKIMALAAAYRVADQDWRSIGPDECDRAREALRAAIVEALDLGEPVGYIDRKDIARLSNYKATIWPGTNEIDAVPLYAPKDKP